MKMCCFIYQTRLSACARFGDRAPVSEPILEICNKVLSVCVLLQVFQVLNEKKHLYAVKYVNLKEADQQTVDSYKNEIAHLNKLQQHSDKIIRLYD